MKSESAEALQWFTDFANLTLETIKPGDKAKLLVEAEEYLWPKEEMREFQTFPPSRGKTILDNPISKKQWKNLAWALEEIPDKESQEYWALILHSQEVIRRLFLKHLIVSVYPTDRNVAMTRPTQMMRGSDEFWWRVSWGPKIPFKIEFFRIASNQDDYVSFKIITLLERGGFLGHAIRICPGCEKFFFNPTRREKEFCSPRCMWRVNTAKRREADPEGYREYQKTLMKDLLREEKDLRRLKTKARKQRCPKCKGKFFPRYRDKGILKVRESCPHCGYRIEPQKISSVKFGRKIA